MNRTEFADKFILALHTRSSKRSDLVREVAEILRIEPEPASRRLNGNVNFSINEMGILAKTLDISLDGIMSEESNMLEIHSILESPWRHLTMDPLADLMERHLDISERICCTPYEYGTVIDSLPFMFIAGYPNLVKLFLFRWGHLFVGSEEFNDYASWDIPRRFLTIKERFINLEDSNKNLFCIWDEMLIYSQINEINYLYSVNVLDDESKERIKADLHAMLGRIEHELKNSDGELPGNPGITFYISNLQLGANCWYAASDKGQASFFYTHFTRSKISQNACCCKTIKKWFCSLKRMSTLISGSGHRERRAFFKKQHDLIDECLI